MHKSWWKLLAVVLLTYTVIAGFLGPVPHLPLLQETIRNLYFHVCMWFAMMILFTVSVVNSVRYLRSFKLKYDIYARQFAVVGIFFDHKDLGGAHVFALVIRVPEAAIR